ncbi:uncharacterized protein PV07_12693, partial [Cladophialophora immunda]
RGQTLMQKGPVVCKGCRYLSYAKGGKPFSLIDKTNDQRVQVRVPADCEVINLLIKAFDKGMKLDSARVVVVENTRRHDAVEKSFPPSSPSRRRENPAEERPRERRYVRDDYDVVEIIPHSSWRDRRERTVYHDDRGVGPTRYEHRERPRSVVYTGGKGSLYVRDEEERRRRERYERQPVVIVAAHGQWYAARR